MNPLDRHPTARRRAYYIQFVISGVLMLIPVGYGAVPGAELPSWFAVVSAVTSAAWCYLGLTAGRNVDIPTGPTGPGELGEG